VNSGDDISKAGGGDYERPGNRHRCGRGAVWRKPCHAGPTPDGKCGGVAECQPVFQNGKYECRRPAGAGGSCAEGPKPDGSCAQCRPLCVPRLTLRSRRGRTSWQICVLLVLLLAAGFHFGRGEKELPLAIDPGPLSAKHAHFTTSQGCAACHDAHDANLGQWVKAAFTRTDMSAKCTACHTFAGDAATPHNENGFLGSVSKVKTQLELNDAASLSPQRGEGLRVRGGNDHAQRDAEIVSTGLTPHPGPLPVEGRGRGSSLRETDCRMCHTEHRGANAKITTLTDAQCNTCHQVKMESFTRGHPAFPPNFPRVAHADVKFDHAKHLLQHFKQPEFTARARPSCGECHAASPTERDVLTLGFETACARCHAEQIPQNELVLLRLPEPTAPADLPKLGADDATTFMAWFLQRAGGTNYGTALQQFLAASAKEGVAPLAKAFDAQIQINQAQRGGAPVSDPASSKVTAEPGRRPALQSAMSASLLAGLSPELLLRPAQLWTNQLKFEAPASKPQSGWYWLEDLYPELHYKPARHADAVTRAWIEFAFESKSLDSNDDADLKRASAFRNEITHLSTGIGHCLKCHVVSHAANAKGLKQIEWQYHRSELQPHTKFSHGAHIGLMHCEDCHALNPKADYETQFKTSTRISTPGLSNFKSIELPNCAKCHAEKKVRNDCGLCHEYHRSPSLKEIVVLK
jgi:hypothetical protein